MKRPRTSIVWVEPVAVEGVVVSPRHLGRGTPGRPRHDTLRRVSGRSSHQLAEGDEIARGRSVLRSLGGGSRYEVLLVWDEPRFAIMVAKVLRPDVTTDPEALEDLREESAALDALAHPVILRGFDGVLGGRFPHLLVEHLEGPSLRRLLKAERTLPLQQLLPLALHVAAGLHYMTIAGWVHLDIKPDNLIMGVPPGSSI
jgi:eukaryotic-like serine/threonine-protein kinase